MPPEQAAAPSRAMTVRGADKTDVIDRVLAAVAARAPDEDVRRWAAARLANGEGARNDIAPKAG